MIIIINVKSFVKRHFRVDFNKHFLKTILLMKKALLYTNGSEVIFVESATKVDLKNLKT